MNDVILLQMALRQEWDALRDDVGEHLTCLDYCSGVPAIPPPTPRVIAMTTGVGKVSAALALTHILSKVQSVAGVVSVGYCGALSGELERGSLLIASKVMQHDFGARTRDGEWLARPGDRTLQYRGLNADVGFTCDTELTLLLSRSCHAAGIRVQSGVIATGDVFVADPDVAAKVRAATRADAIDMESGAVAQVCARFGVPFGCAKTVSDVVGADTCGQYLDALEQAPMRSYRLIVRHFLAALG